MKSEVDQPASRRRPRNRGLWLLLVLPYAGLLFPQLYARNTPVLFGFPFFYWYQLGWVLLTAVLLVVYYKLSKTESAHLEDAE